MKNVLLFLNKSHFGVFIEAVENLLSGSRSISIHDYVYGTQPEIRFTEESLIEAIKYGKKEKIFKHLDKLRELYLQHGIPPTDEQRGLYHMLKLLDELKECYDVIS
ncbi:MAG: hypothetical protein KGI58_02785 [Patescibacteria group bacterium]|nr:hypothetical protein [Patescibacteria group bacterium]